MKNRIVEWVLAGATIGIVVTAFHGIGCSSITDKWPIPLPWTNAPSIIVPTTTTTTTTATIPVRPPNQQVTDYTGRYLPATIMIDGTMVLAPCFQFAHWSTGAVDDNTGRLGGEVGDSATYSLVMLDGITKVMPAAREAGAFLAKVPAYSIKSVELTITKGSRKWVYSVNKPMERNLKVVAVGSP